MAQNNAQLGLFSLDEPAGNRLFLDAAYAANELVRPAREGLGSKLGGLL
jgi:hypothetical protein